MNFTYYNRINLFIQKIINNLPKNNINKIRTSIHNEINNLLNKYKDGEWQITGSESIYILNLLKIIEIMYSNENKKTVNELNKLLKHIKDNSEDKIKIVFFAQEYSVWPSLQSFYDACNNDDRFIAQLIYIPFFHQNSANGYSQEDYYSGKSIPNEHMEPYWHAGYKVIPFTMYDLSKESPDIAVYVKPYDLIPKEYQIENVSKIVKRCVYIRYGFEIAAWNLNYHFKLPLQSIAWKFIVYGEKIKELAKKECIHNGNNISAWGHPRADYYLNIKEKRKNIPEEWKTKINGRKTILWNTQHTVKDNEGAGTFFKWKDEVFDYFSGHKDMVLLWRPHPLMFGALKNSGLMTNEELDKLIYETEQKDNVILDRSDDYRNSFYASDAIITDGTAFLIEYLYTGKPLIYTIKDTKDTIYFKEDFCNNVYIAKNTGDITANLEMIRQRQDPLKEKRLSFAKELLTVHPEGNGEYIKNQIYNELVKECSEV